MSWPSIVLLGLLASAPTDEAGPTLASRTRVQAINRMNEGIQAAGREDMPAAEAALRDAIAIDPTYPEAHHTLAQLHRKQGQLDAARDSLTAGLAIAGLEKSLEADLAYELGAVLSSQAEGLTGRSASRERWGQALAALDRALAADPRRYKAVHRRAVALDHLDRVSEADDAYRACIALKPTYANCFTGLAYLYTEFGHIDVARRVLEAGVQVAPYELPLYLATATLELGAGRASEAITAADIAVKMDPESPDAWYLLGMAQSERRLRKEAVESLQKYLALAGEGGRQDLLTAARDTVERLKDLR